MIKPEQVPDEVWTLVQLCTGMGETAARGLAAGVINTWPGVIHYGHWLMFPHTKIPMPQENTND